MTISVVVPTYNRARFLRFALNSVLAQTYRDFEVVVVDDGSTDETEHLVSEYSGRVRYIYQENRGRGAARNVGVQHATGEYIAFLDSDDVWYLDKLARQIAFLEANPDSMFVHGPVDFVREDGSRDEKETRRVRRLFEDAKRRGYSYESLVDSCVMFTSAVMVKRDCFERNGGFVESAFTAREDFEWYLRVARRDRIEYLDGAPLASYRLHEGNVFRNNEMNVVEEYRKIFMKQLEVLAGSADEAAAGARVHLSLAFCYEGLGRPEMVRYHIWRALAFDPRSALRVRTMIRFFKSVLRRS